MHNQRQLRELPLLPLRLLLLHQQQKRCPFSFFNLHVARKQQQQQREK